MVEIEKRVTLMIGEYTMNEYKTYKALVKHKRRINCVFTEVCGDKSFNSRRPGRKLKVPVVTVASFSAAPISAPRRRSSKRGSSVIEESTSSGVQPSKTRSLESTKRKRRTSEQISDAELQAASGLAQMSRKNSKHCHHLPPVLRRLGEPVPLARVRQQQHVLLQARPAEPHAGVQVGATDAAVTTDGARRP
jgi:hypothetical protein